MLGVGIIFSPLDLLKALLWSAVINGVVAVPIMVAMIMVVRWRTQMGTSRATTLLAWAATLIMGRRPSL